MGGLGCNSVTYFTSKMWMKQLFHPALNLKGVSFAPTKIKPNYLALRFTRD